MRQAIDADVHVIGISSQAAAHRTLVPQLVQLLKVRPQLSAGLQALMSIYQPIALPCCVGEQGE